MSVCGALCRYLISIWFSKKMFLDCERKSTDMNGDTLEMKVKEVVICVEKWNPEAVFLRGAATATSVRRSMPSFCLKKSQITKLV